MVKLLGYKYPLRTPGNSFTGSKFNHGIPRLPKKTTGNPLLEQGVLYLGQELKNSRSKLWLSKEDIRQHILVLAEESDRKREVLMQIASNSLDKQGGLLWIDSGGGISLYHRIKQLCRKYDREEDLYLIDFTSDKNTKELADTTFFNPFDFLDSEEAVKLLIDIIDWGRDPEFLGMWKERAIKMIGPVVQALYWLHNNSVLPYTDNQDHNNGIELNMSLIQEYLEIDKIIELSDPLIYPQMHQEIRDGLNLYLNSLPAYDRKRGKSQSITTLDCHGYLIMQFTRYINMFNTTLISYTFMNGKKFDLERIIMEKKIAIILLKEFSVSEEMYNISRVIFILFETVLNQMYSNLLKNCKKENDISDGENNFPFLGLFDSPEMYIPNGTATKIARQARNLDVGLIYASQSIQSMLAVGRSEATSIIANTSTKILIQDQITTRVCLAMERIDRKKQIVADLIKDGYKFRASLFESFDKVSEQL